MIAKQYQPMQIINQRLTNSKINVSNNQSFSLSTNISQFFQTQIQTSQPKKLQNFKKAFPKNNHNSTSSLYKKKLTTNDFCKESNKLSLKRASILKNKPRQNPSTKSHFRNQLGIPEETKNCDGQKIEVKQYKNFFPSKQLIPGRGSTRAKSSHKLTGVFSGIQTPINQISLQSKWQKVIELYTMRDQLAKKYQFPSASQLKRKYPILPSGEFYRILIKNRVFQKQWRINFPETIFLDNDGNVVMIYTDVQSGILKKKIIEKQGKQKDKYIQQVFKFKSNFIEALQKTNKIRLFKELKLQTNPNAPITIMKYAEDNCFEFETDVQSDRNFNQRKLKPTRDSIVQRYIYSNNMKAMIFRLYYRRHNPVDPNSPQYEGIRFVNQRTIFKQSGSTNFPQIHKLTSTITLSDKRVDTIKVMPITNLKALQKFTVIGKEVQKMLQYTQKVVIDKLYLDFIVDVFDKPWLINMKYCEINPNSILRNYQPKQDHIRNASSCRLCGIADKKQNLENSVSVRMLCEFIHHLKKRTKNQNLHEIDFIQNLNINSKQNKSLSVCKICYKLIIHELDLMKIEIKLAQICNVSNQSDLEIFDAENKLGKGEKNMGQYKQWRLMLYFEDIKNGNQLYSTQSHSVGFRSNQTRKQEDEQMKFQRKFYLKYQLCPKISENFLCRKESSSSNNLTVNQVKLHYFYSETPNIEEFINNTEIKISLYCLQQSFQFKDIKYFTNYNNNTKFEGHFEKNKTQKVSKGFSSQRLIASGSTRILSSFNHCKTSSLSLKTLMQSGQQKTATVLLFFQNKKYCELTLKVGLVYDGSYNISDIPIKRDKKEEVEKFVKWNDVWFSIGRWNSNPLPQEWMQIFGSKYNYNMSQMAMEKGELDWYENRDKLIEKILKEESVYFQQNNL